jgi:uncharacterized protein (UPF0335 family)
MTGALPEAALTPRAPVPKTWATHAPRHQETFAMPATAAANKEEEKAVRFAKDQLRAFVERVEKLEEEKKAISDDIRDVYAESKANGFDVKALRTIVRLRKMDANERAEQDAILETYMHALGMLKN